LALLIGIALAAFYWLPVFPELSYTNVLSVVGGGSNYKDHFVCLSQLWNSPWGFGGSAPGCIDGLSFKIGKIQTLLSIFSLPALFILFKKDKVKASIVIFFVLSYILSIFLMLKESQFIWNAVPHMAFFQFPWRFLLLTSFFTSFLGGAVVYLLPNSRYHIKYVFAVLIISVTVYINYKIFVPQTSLNKNSENYTNKSTLNFQTSKISDEYLPKSFISPVISKFVPKSRLVANKDIKISNLSDKTQLISFTTQAEKKANLRINLAYFPAWHVFMDHQQVWFKYSNRGLILDIPKGKHEVDVKFVQTPIEKAGDIVSLAGVMVLIIGIIKLKRNNYNG
jgi:hypothetical protein